MELGFPDLKLHSGHESFSPVLGSGIECQKKGCTTTVRMQLTGFSCGSLGWTFGRFQDACSLGTGNSTCWRDSSVVRKGALA